MTQTIGVMALYLIGYGLTILLSINEYDLMAAAVLYVCAIVLYLFFATKRKRLFDLEALISFFWNFGIATSCLKLSKLATVWSPMTWASFLLFYLSFVLFFETRGLFRKQKSDSAGELRSGAVQEVTTTENLQHEIPSFYAGRVLICIVGMTAVSFAAFLAEAAILGFVPMLIRDTPHAYSTFHVTGVHYLTVSSVMVHPLTVIYLFTERQKTGTFPKRSVMAVLGICNAIAISVPFLCVSRYFMIMSVALTMIVYISLKKTIAAKHLIRLAVLCVLVMVPAYLILTVFRSHSVSYLNEIFEMKNPDMPIFITQPYMYVANNYDNFNCLVTGLDHFKLGVRQLFPLEALTGLKFILPPEFVSTSADYITKTELTTVTILYDAYYDFGIAGVIGFGAILGRFCAYLTAKTEHVSNPILWLFCGQIAMYLILSFFTTWFSNPTTWFWLAATAAMMAFTGFDSGRISEQRAKQKTGH